MVCDREAATGNRAPVEYTAHFRAYLNACRVIFDEDFSAAELTRLAQNLRESGIALTSGQEFEEAAILYAGMVSKQWEEGEIFCRAVRRLCFQLREGIIE